MLGESLWDMALEWILAIVYVDRAAYPRRRDYVVAIIKSVLLGLVLLALTAKMVWFLHQTITAFCQPKVFSSPSGAVYVLPASGWKQMALTLYGYPYIKYLVYTPILFILAAYFYGLFLANKILKLIYMVEAWAYYKILVQIWAILHTHTWQELGAALWTQSRKMLGV